MIYFLCYNLLGQIQLVNDCNLFSTPVFISHCEYYLLTKKKTKNIFCEINDFNGIFLFHQPFLMPLFKLCIK